LEEAEPQKNGALMKKMFLTVLFTSLVFAQQSKEFTASALKAMGGPNNPKV
jgi:hypothetical protein